MSAATWSGHGGNASFAFAVVIGVFAGLRFCVLSLADA
jgi:hypothetical protein